MTPFWDHGREKKLWQKSITLQNKCKQGFKNAEREWKKVLCILRLENKVESLVLIMWFVFFKIFSKLYIFLDFTPPLRLKSSCYCLHMKTLRVRTCLSLGNAVASIHVMNPTYFTKNTDNSKAMHVTNCSSEFLGSLCLFLPPSLTLKLILAIWLMMDRKL